VFIVVLIAKMTTFVLISIFSIRSAHNLTPEPTNMLKTIYKCPLCESVFSDSNHSQQLFVLHKHFDGHIDSARITAFKVNGNFNFVRKYV